MPHTPGAQCLEVILVPVLPLNEVTLVDDRCGLQGIVCAQDQFLGTDRVTGMQAETQGGKLPCLCHHVTSLGSA